MTRGAANGSRPTTPTTVGGSPKPAPIVAVKRLLLLVWAVWLSVVFLSNLADAAKGLGWLPESWAFASGNLHSIRQTTARYGTPDAVNGVLFAGVVVWEGVPACLFSWASCANGPPSIFPAHRG
jgi:hypothetical protein